VLMILNKTRQKSITLSMDIKLDFLRMNYLFANVIKGG